MVDGLEDAAPEEGCCFLFRGALAGLVFSPTATGSSLI